MKDEKILLAKLKKGDPAAFQELYEHYADRIYFTAIKFHFSVVEAEELVQDVFLKIWENKANLQVDRSFKSFIITTARNMLINQLKRKTYEVTCKKYFHKFGRHFENSTEDYIIFSDLKANTDQFIDSLPANRKQILLMRRDKGLSNKEIAEQLGISQRTVENNIYKADRALKTFLGKNKANSWLLLFLSLIFF